MLDTEKALKSKNLTDEERLNCGMKRIAVFMKLGNEDAAVEEYKKYIIGCPLFPKYDFGKEKIIIRNVPDCKCYKNFAKELMLSDYCENEEDICEYGNKWIVNVTKKDCNQCKITKKEDFPSHLLILDEGGERSPEQIRACCNTVNKLAAAANLICGCVTTPFGPITNTACKAACVVFVEAIREEAEWCCYNGGYEKKCWKKYDTWKNDFKRKNGNCPKPPHNCP
jgi:hypothetical protein